MLIIIAAEDRAYLGLTCLLLKGLVWELCIAIWDKEQSLHPRIDRTRALLAIR